MGCLQGQSVNFEKLRTSRCGYLARICAWRRRLALPTTEPFGRSASVCQELEMKASRTSSRGRLHGRIVPAGKYVGTSCAQVKQTVGLVPDISTGEGKGKAAGPARLHGVHSNVDAPLQQRIVNLFGEQALAANVSKRLIQYFVAGRLDNANLQCALLLQLREGCLPTLHNLRREEHA